MVNDLLSEVRAAAEALTLAETRRLAAIRAAFDAGCKRGLIADAAGITRDGVYKLLRPSPPESSPERQPERRPSPPDLRRTP